MVRLRMLGACAIAITLFAACPPANARPPDVVGQKYSDAVSTLTAAGLKPIVTATFGSRLSRDDCIVSGITDHKILRPAVGDTFYEFGWGEVFLALNCNGAYATSHGPGNSMGSPEGRKAADHEAEVQWRSENPGWCVKAMRDHPEWGQMEGCSYG